MATTYEYYPATSFTGGGTGALDAIDGNDLAVGDVAIVSDNNVSYTYKLKSASGKSESYPNIIIPDTNPGTKYWERVCSDASFLCSRKASADSIDDEFESTTLDAQWTAVGPSSGTVDLFETSSTVNKYDLTTRPGWLLMQAGSTKTCSFRQDATLGDGESVVLAISAGMTHDDIMANNQLSAGLALTSSDTSHSSGDHVQLILDSDGSTTADTRIKFWDGISVEGLTSTSIVHGTMVYLRFHRVSLTYYALYSLDGSTWIHIGSETETTAFSNIWIFHATSSGALTPYGISAVKWIRQGGSGLDPWKF